MLARMIYFNQEAVRRMLLLWVELRMICVNKEDVQRLLLQRDVSKDDIF